MSDKIEFEGQEFRVPKRIVTRNLFVDFLIKKGLAKNRQQAMYVLFGVIGACFFTTIFLLVDDKNEPKQPYGGGSNPEFQVKQ